MSKTAEECCNCEHFRKDDIATRIAGAIRMVCDRDGTLTAPDGSCGHRKAPCAGGCRCPSCNTAKDKMDADIERDFKLGPALLLCAVLMVGCQASELDDFLVIFGRENNIEIVNKTDPKIIFCESEQDVGVQAKCVPQKFMVQIYKSGDNKIFILKDEPAALNCIMFIYRYYPMNWKEDEQKWKALLKKFREQWEARVKK